MKRMELVRRLRQAGYEALREGANHTLYFNPDSDETAVVPRHAEIKERLARKILGDAGAKRDKHVP